MGSEHVKTQSVVWSEKLVDFPCSKCRLWDFDAMGDKIDQDSVYLKWRQDMSANFVRAMGARVLACSDDARGLYLP
jgi:hypothetical protein